MMDYRPALALLSGIVMMVVGVYCLDAAPERPLASADDSGGTLPGIATATAAPDGSWAANKSAHRRILRVRLQVHGGKPVTVPELVAVPLGSPVAFLVESDTWDHFEVPGYGVSVAVAPGQPGSVAFDADRPGHYPFRMAASGLTLGRLEVVP